MHIKTDKISLPAGGHYSSLQKFNNTYIAKSLCVFVKKPREFFQETQVLNTSFLNFILVIPTSLLGLLRFGAYTCMFGCTENGRLKANSVQCITVGAHSLKSIIISTVYGPPDAPTSCLDSDFAANFVYASSLNATIYTGYIKKR